MAKRITISEVNAPSAGLAEAFARLILEREQDRPMLTLVEKSDPETAGYKLPDHDPIRSLSPV